MTIRLKVISLLLLPILLPFLSMPVLAHHSFAAQYDSNKPVTLTGLVTKVEWANPHVYLYIDVAGENGDYEQWALEMGAPAVLTRIQGWSRSTLQVGDEINIEGRLARDGSNLANARNVTLVSGETLGAGSSENTTP
jgi:hypothetical protein